MPISIHSDPTLDGVTSPKKATPHETDNNLNDLFEFIERQVKLEMRERGSVHPKFYILTATGLLVLDVSMEDEMAKERALRTSRLLCIANRARGVVVAAEAWMSTGSAVESPSKDPARKEIIMLFGETYSHRKQKILTIQRTASGTFHNFGDAKTFPAHTLDGRFTHILSSHPPTTKDQAKAKRFLENLGISNVPAMMCCQEIRPRERK